MFIDYYEVLQVHLRAEPMIIKSAYKRLCHKYHPDNAGNKEMIHLLREAYEVLSHEEKRQCYNKEWLIHYGKDVSVGPIEKTTMYDFSIVPLLIRLKAYMDAIKDNDFEKAYQLLSKYNRQRLFKKDFVKWQRLVSEIHQVVAYECSPIATKDANLEMMSYLSNHKYMIFKVKVKEKSQLLGRYEEDSFNRIMVNEDGQWSVFLLIDNIKKVIKKYHRLVEMNQKKSKFVILGQLKSHYTYNTGWVEKKQLLWNLEHEQLRYLRYKSTYSVAVFRLKKGATDDKQFQNLSELLETHTRILDSLCQLRKSMILLLYPETNKKSADLATNKLLKAIEQALLLQVIDTVHVHEQSYDTVKELLSEVVK